MFHISAGRNYSLPKFKEMPGRPLFTAFCERLTLTQTICRRLLISYAIPESILCLALKVPNKPPTKRKISSITDVIPICLLRKYFLRLLWRSSAGIWKKPE